jgi:hypothetical protein
MSQPSTDITLLLDRTGSMQVVCDETIQAVNTFIADQKKVPGAATFTLVQFDSQDPFEVLQRSVNIQDAYALTAETYVPRAWTPLLDAIGRTINDTGSRLSSLPESERPEKVIVAIMTDGLENASKEFTRDRILAMVKLQSETYKWQFVYLGANQDAIKEAVSLGMPAANAMTYQHTGDGVKHATQSYSANVSAYRTGLRNSMAFSEEDRKKQRAN